MLALINRLGETAAQRIERLEARHETLREDVELRLRRYEDTAERSADRIVSAVERLAKLEMLPDRLEEIDRDISAMRGQIAEIDKRLTAYDARQQGRNEILKHGVRFASWLWEHGWKVLLVIAALLALLKEYVIEASAAPVQEMRVMSTASYAPVSEAYW